MAMSNLLWNAALAAVAYIVLLASVLPKSEFNSGRIVWYIVLAIGAAFLTSWLFTPFLGRI